MNRFIRHVLFVALALSSFAFAQAQTRVIVSVSPNPVYETQGFGLKAQIFGTRPTGTVIFRTAGGVVLGRANVEVNTITGVYEALSSGVYPDNSGSTSLIDGVWMATISADYSGDAGNTPATGSAFLELKPRVATTLAVLATPNTAVVGQAVTLVTNVGGFVDGLGLVRLSDNGVEFAVQGTNPPGVATTTTRFTTAGSHLIHAGYANSRTDLPSFASGIIVTVAAAASTTALSASPSPAYLNNPVTLTATVTGPGVTATGTVIFRDGPTDLGSAALVAGKATLSRSFAVIGSHSLSATYSGDSNYRTSDSAVSTLLISAKPATTTVLSASPATVYANQTVTLTSTVTGASPTGSVTFSAGATVLATVALTAGKATLAWKFSTAAAPAIQATYSGDSNNAASNSSSVTVTVVPQFVPTLTLTPSVTSAELYQSVTLTAQLSGLGPSTESTAVKFLDGASVLGTVVKDVNHRASLTVSFNSAGVHAFSAVSSGNTSDVSRTATASLTVNRRVTTVNLTATPTVTYQGQDVVLQASGLNIATSPIQYGTFAFYDGATLLTRIAAISSARPVVRLSTVGTRTLTVVYSGTGNNSTSTSAPLIVTVAAALPYSPPPVANLEYDAQGNHTKRVLAPSAGAFTTTLAYDALDRATRRTDALSGIAQYGFDGVDQREWVMDARNLVTEYPTTGLGDAQRVSPDTGLLTNGYNPSGTLSRATDARGAVTTYGYDVLQRLISKTSTLGGQSLVTTFVFDEVNAATSYGIGRMTSSVSPDATQSFSYDATGNVTRATHTILARSGTVTTPIVKTVTATYDLADRRTSLTYPSGRTITYTLLAGRVTGLLLKDLTGVQSPLLTTVATLPNGEISDWLWGTTQRHARAFDQWGRVRRYPLGELTRDLTYDAAGRVVAYTHTDAFGAAAPAWNQAFTYDATGRLTTATMGTTVTTYSYDPNGNRTQVVVGAGTPSVLTISTASNRVTSATNPARVFTYDAAGNQLSDGRLVATYDARNRMSAAGFGSASTRFGYDAVGRRVSKTNASGGSLFVYDTDDHLLGEYSLSGALVREYVWLGDRPVAVLLPPSTAAGAVNVFYIHADHLNTPRAVVSVTGQLRWRWLGDAFGVTPPEENPAGLGAFVLPLRMPGQYFDAETGLFQNYHRDYDPTLGRYLESDPIGLEGGLNTYAYVDNAPTSAVDPDGHNPIALGRAFQVGYKIGEAINPVVQPAIARALELIRPPLKYELDDFLTEADKRVKDAEHDLYKMTCSEPPPGNLDKCEAARWKLWRGQRCLRGRTEWDRKWWPGRHAQDIARTEREIANAIKEVTRECYPCKP